MPRTRGKRHCEARISSASCVSIQAWATVAEGIPYRAAVSVGYRVSATCWLRSDLICMVPMMLCSRVDHRFRHRHVLSPEE
jgi:hypothetical protein